MKNKDFFYLQYNKVDWQNQKRTRLNSNINNFIIDNIILKNKKDLIKLFDIGFGVGLFFEMLRDKLCNIILEGCEPSLKNYNNFKQFKDINLFNKTFLETSTKTRFDFITAIYVFPHFESDEMIDVAKKIYSMLESKGKFIMVVANNKYIQEKLRSKKDLFIEKNTIPLGDKNYKEILHYSEIPNIGTIIDYNRDEKYYIELFKKNGFKLGEKKDLDDNGFVCTVFVFEKN